MQSAVLVMRDLRIATYLLLIALFSALLYSCASMGTPSGGPRDEDPPRLLHSTPAPDALNFKGERVVLTFDELVNVKDAFSRVVVSPPGDGTPRVTSSGRRVYVQFPDTLRSNTTYTIDFGTSIEDNNEANPLGSFSISFSTGETIDSLRLGGVVLDAYTLEPQQNILVGVHRADAPDSALRTLPFERVTKTDDRGRFTLRGLRPVPYNLFALADVNNDYRRDNPAELLAFYPHPVTPYSESAVTSDTVYDRLSDAVDTVVERAYTRFLPNNLLLSVFDEGFKPQYLVKYERPDSARLRFVFNAPSEYFPSLSFLNIPDRAAYRLEYTAGRDTLDYWLADPRFIAADTLRLSLAYRLTDAERNITQRTDTLTLLKPKVRVQKKKRSRKQMQADSIAAAKAQLLGVQINPSGTLDIYALPSIEFSEPVSRIDTAGVHLFVRQDTLWIQQPRPMLEPDTTSASRRWQVKMRTAPGMAYRLNIDSMAVVSIYGRINPAVSHELSVKKKEDYASLTLRLIPDTIAGFVEVLNSGDKPVQRVRVVNGVAYFPWLSPDDYYARFVADLDSNFRFTPGDYQLRRQPEDVYYYPGLLSLKRHDRSEQWNLNAVPVDRQKPAKLIKNKPASAKRRVTAEEEPEEEDDTFDVNANPFATPSSSLRMR